MEEATGFTVNPSEAGVAFVQSEIYKPPNWQITFQPPGAKAHLLMICMFTDNPPNWFYRFTQRLILGIYWTRLP